MIGLGLGIGGLNVVLAAFLCGATVQAWSVVCLLWLSCGARRMWESAERRDRLLREREVAERAESVFRYLRATVNQTVYLRSANPRDN